MADTQILPLGAATVPADWIVPDAQTVTLGALFAHFDGSGASKAFVPTVQIISDSGHTVLEVPQDATVAAGGSAEASWAPQLDAGVRLSGAHPYHLISAGSTNSTLVAAGAQELTGYYLVNTGVVFAYVKMYDKATAPTVGTDTPVAVFGIPPTAAANVAMESPVQFALGLGFGITLGIADSDATAVVASQVSVTLYHQ